MEGFKKIALLAFLVMGPTTAFGWHDYVSYGDWDYHGSGRDHPYSYYINDYYTPTFVTFSLYQPDADIEPYYLPTPAAPVAQPNAFTVNIPNDHGGFTSVVIRRSGNGYVGPQGEYYPEFPKVFQLKMMYGK